MTVDLTDGVDPGREWFLAERPEKPDIRDASNIWFEASGADVAIRAGVEADILMSCFRAGA